MTSSGSRNPSDDALVVQPPDLGTGQAEDTSEDLIGVLAELRRRRRRYPFHRGEVER